MSYCCVKPLATKRALYLEVEPSGFCFSLNTHLHPTILTLLGLGTRDHVWFFYNASNSDCMAVNQVGSAIATRKEVGVVTAKASLVGSYHTVPSVNFLGKVLPACPRVRAPTGELSRSVIGSREMTTTGGWTSGSGDVAWSQREEIGVDGTAGDWTADDWTKEDGEAAETGMSVSMGYSGGTFGNKSLAGAVMH